MSYRVYDKKKKRWVEDKIFMTPNGDLLKSDKSILGWTKPTFVSENRYVYQKEIEGFYDKNGKQVYVGDYVNAKVAEDRTVTGLVTFANELSAYIIICFDSEEYFTLGTQVCELIEVIGNVFDDDKKKK